MIGQIWNNLLHSLNCSSDKFVLLLTDAAPYMKTAGHILEPLYPNLFHVTSMEFEECSTVHKRSSCGRGDFVNNDDVEAVELAIQALNEEGILRTTRNVYKIVSRSHSTVGKIMKKNLFFKPCKIQTCQFLTATHKIQRLQFCERFLCKVQNDSSFLDRVIFSDESYFSLSGLVNKQNTRFWRNSKPTPVETKRFDKKVFVWIGFSTLFKIPPVIISNSTLTQTSYIEMLKSEVVPFLKSKRVWKKSVLQQDGAKPHTSNFKKVFSRW